MTPTTPVEEARAELRGAGIAALDIIGEDEHGQVIVSREADDGTVILLACRKIDTGNGTPPEGPILRPTGEPVEPKPPKGSYPEGGGTFPHLFASVPSPLVLDISDMPRGVLMFEPARFAAAALQALRNGVTSMDIRPATAELFGFHGIADLPG